MSSELKKLNVLMCEFTLRHLHPAIELADRTDTCKVVPYVSSLMRRTLSSQAQLTAGRVHDRLDWLGCLEVRQESENLILFASSGVLTGNIC